MPITTSPNAMLCQSTFANFTLPFYPNAHARKAGCDNAEPYPNRGKYWRDTHYTVALLASFSALTTLPSDGALSALRRAAWS